MLGVPAKHDPAHNGLRESVHSQHTISARPQEGLAHHLAENAAC